MVVAEANGEVVTASADAIDSFSSELNDFSASVNSLITNPSNLADSVTSLFNTIDGLYTSVDATVEVLQGFFDFGDNDIEPENTTAIRVESNQNNNVLNGTMQGEALILSYFNATQVTFSTVEDLDELSQRLEDQYQRIITNGLSEDAKSTITDLRTETQKFFDAQRVSIRQIITVETNIIPARVLAFQYYGSSELGADIAGLNNDPNVSFLEGSTRILTE